LFQEIAAEIYKTHKKPILLIERVFGIAKLQNASIYYHKKVSTRKLIFEAKESENTYTCAHTLYKQTLSQYKNIICSTADNIKINSNSKDIYNSLSKIIILYYIL
jgi:hypothetical protein